MLGAWRGGTRYSTNEGERVYNDKYLSYVIAWRIDMRYLTRIMLIIVLILCSVFSSFAQEAQRADQEKQQAASQSRQEEKQKAASSPDEHAQRVGRIFLKLRNATDIEQKVAFQMVKDAEPNAFAAPLDAGKYKFDYVVAVSYSMVVFVQSDDELAVVIGHELAHIAKGHIESKKREEPSEPFWAVLRVSR